MNRRTVWVNVALGAAIVGVLVLILAALRPQPPDDDLRTVTVYRGDVVATVSASGSVDPAGSVELLLPTGGRITAVYVSQGDEVAAGDVLAEVDDSLALQQLAAAESTLAQAWQAASSADASIASASAALADAKRLAKQTNKRNELAVEQATESLRAAEALWGEACVDPANATCPNPAAQARIRAALASIDTAQRNLDTAEQSAVTNAAGYDLAISQAAETWAQRQRQQDAACATSSTSTTCITAEGSTVAARQAYDNAVVAGTVGRQVDEQAQQSASLALASANVALQQVQAELRQAGVDAQRSARQTLETAERNLRQGRATGEQSVNSAQAALTSALTARESVSVGEDEVTASDAVVASAEAGVVTAQRSVEDTRIVAPASAVVTTVPYVEGEFAGALGIVLTPNGPTQVVAEFAESDAAAIRVGAEATVTFDALGGLQATGVVIDVAPAASSATTGLVTYAVRVLVENAPEDVRNGMTVSVSVVVAEVSDVVWVPQSAITGPSSRPVVLVLDDEGETTATPITIGVQGDLGTEVVAGLEEGQTLVIPSVDDLSFPEGGVPGQGGRPPNGRPIGGGGD